MLVCQQFLSHDHLEPNRKARIGREAAVHSAGSQAFAWKQRQAIRGSTGKPPGKTSRANGGNDTHPIVRPTTQGVIALGMVVLWQLSGRLCLVNESIVS